MDAKGVAYTPVWQAVDASSGELFALAADYYWANTTVVLRYGKDTGKLIDAWKPPALVCPEGMGRYCYGALAAGGGRVYLPLIQPNQSLAVEVSAEWPGWFRALPQCSAGPTERSCLLAICWHSILAPVMPHLAAAGVHCWRRGAGQFAGGDR